MQAIDVHPIVSGCRVQLVDTRDHDCGSVIDVNVVSGIAVVAWDSGDTGCHPLDDLIEAYTQAELDSMRA